MRPTARALLRHHVSTALSGYRKYVKKTVFPVIAASPLGRSLIPLTLKELCPNPLGLDESNQYISKAITEGSPRMIGRFGESELRAYLKVLRLNRWGPGSRFLWTAMSAERPKWRNDEFAFLGNPAGFFPTDDRDAIEAFADLMGESAAGFDLIGSWVKGENLVREFSPTSQVTSLGFLEPFFSAIPWTSALAGKRVLVVHPFRKSIIAQYGKRKLLFDEGKCLPNFELAVTVPPQTINFAGERDEFEYGDWFAAYESLQRSIEVQDFDVAIIGAGSYGMPLAAHIKSLGKVAIHLGGATQLIFGIWGGRWDRSPKHAGLANSDWVRPHPSEVPARASEIESSAYW
jgi:hypothetical protein